MNLTLIVAIIVAGTLATFTDWLFMGVLFQGRYKKYPETWWPRPDKKSERGAILWSSVLGYVSAAAVVLLCLVAGVRSIAGGLAVASLAAAAGPLVTTPTAGFWIRIDPAVTFAHTLGYIVRFLVAGAAAGLVLR